MWDPKLERLKKWHDAGRVLTWDEIEYLFVTIGSIQPTVRQALIKEVRNLLDSGAYSTVEIATASLVDRDREADHRRAHYYDHLTDNGKRRLYKAIEGDRYAKS